MYYGLPQKENDCARELYTGFDKPKSAIFI